jgi:hypothetical protein
VDEAIPVLGPAVGDPVGLDSRHVNEVRAGRKPLWRPPAHQTRGGIGLCRDDFAQAHRVWPKRARCLSLRRRCDLDQPGLKIADRERDEHAPGGCRCRVQNRCARRRETCRRACASHEQDGCGYDRRNGTPTHLAPLHPQGAPRFDPFRHLERLAERHLSADLRPHRAIAHSSVRWVFRPIEMRGEPSTLPGAFRGSTYRQGVR